MRTLDLMSLGIGAVLACAACGGAANQSREGPSGPGAEGGGAPLTEAPGAPEESATPPAEAASKGQKLVGDESRFGEVPEEAKATIAAAYDAALEQDYIALRAIMDGESTWSVDGEASGSVEEATEAWKGNPWPAKKLIMAIEGGCLVEKARVICPRENDMGADYETVFEERGGAWKLTKLTLGG